MLVDTTEALPAYLRALSTCPSAAYLRTASAAYSTLRDQRAALNIAQVTVATAMAFYHRFYFLQRHADAEYHPLLVIAACTLLASKVESTPKAVKAVLRAFFPTETEYTKRAKQICVYEELLIQTTDFTLSCPHPYAAMGRSLRSLYAQIAAEKRLRVQSVCGIILNTSYATPMHLATSKRQDEWVRSIVHVAVKMAGLSADERQVVLLAFGEGENCLVEAEVEAYKCLREVFRMDGNMEVAEGIDGMLAECSVENGGSGQK